MNNELQVVIEQTGIEHGRVQELLSRFGQDFQKAQDVVKNVKDIVVTSEDQIKEMAEARTARLELKSIRIQVEATRKELKEQSLREGKAIDGAANIIKALIIPVEEYLEKQEKFAEELQKKRAAEKLEKRKTELSQFVADISVYDLERISDEVYGKLLADAKKARDEQIAAEKKAEEDRIERERKAQLHYSRKDQLIPYWIFLKGNQISIDFGELSDEEFRIILNEAKAAQKADAEKRIQEQKQADELRKKQEAQEKAMAEERRVAAEAQKKKDDELRKANEEKERLQKEIDDKKKAEAEAKRQQEEKVAKEKAEAVEAERQRLLAPDREKLILLANEIKKIPMPEVQSEKAKKAIQDISGMLGRLDAFIKQRAQTL